jgi:hypothetical protein
MVKNDKQRQFEFVQRLVTVYGFQSIYDFETEISVSDLKQNLNFLPTVNQLVGEMSLLFPMSYFNLARKNYLINTEELAMKIFLKCLSVANINYLKSHKANKNVVRLIFPNLLYIKGIQQNKMENIVHNQSSYTVCHKCSTRSITSPQEFAELFDLPVIEKLSKASMTLRQTKYNGSTIIECKEFNVSTAVYPPIPYQLYLTHYMIDNSHGVDLSDMYIKLSNLEQLDQLCYVGFDLVGQYDRLYLNRDLQYAIKQDSYTTSLRYNLSPLIEPCVIPSHLGKIQQISFVIVHTNPLCDVELGVKISDTSDHKRSGSLILQTITGCPNRISYSDGMMVFERTYQLPKINSLDSPVSSHPRVYYQLISDTGTKSELTQQQIDEMHLEWSLCR